MLWYMKKKKKKGNEIEGSGFFYYSILPAGRLANLMMRKLSCHCCQLLVFSTVDSVCHMFVSTVHSNRLTLMLFALKNKYVLYSLCLRVLYCIGYLPGNRRKSYMDWGYSIQNSTLPCLHLLFSFT